jgi:hypothetical protein
MQAVLQFPHIQVPTTAWFARSLLYWDLVGTIVPDRWVETPEELGRYTQDLVKRGLVRQVFPLEAERRFSALFQDWLESLSNDELEKRRESFRAGERLLIHIDKATYFGLFHLIERLGLSVGIRMLWVEVDHKTGMDFMSALALSLCHPDSDLSRDNRGLWVPMATDPAALRSLLEGLAHLDETPVARTLRLRVEGEVRASEIRLSLLEHGLPVPAEGLDPDLIERIRRRHGHALPACRRRLEEIVDGVIIQESQALRVRALDRVQSEIDDLVAEAEAYLREGGVRRISRAPFIRVLKATPLAGRAIGAVQETAASLETATRIQTEPLAYFALAQAEIKAGRYRAVDSTPLIEQFS